MSFTAINATLTSVATLINQVNNNFVNYYSDKSLSEITKITRVEPLTIISRDCINLEYMPDVMQSLLSVFCGYYLQAINILTKVNSVEVVRILDKLNPDRDSTSFLLGRDPKGFIATESHTTNSMNGLLINNYLHSLPTHSVIALEGPQDDNVKMLNEMSSLSVGKLINVEICFDEKITKQVKKAKTLELIRPTSVTIPVSVRLLSNVVPTETASHLLAYKSEDNSLVERYHSWRAGRISFVKDLVFCQDLITEYKKAIIKDQSDSMQEIVRRVNNNKKFGLLTNNPSLATASSIFVFSEEVAKDIENKLGGKLDNIKIRNKAFENTYAMLLVVVDREWERVKIYTRGVDAYSNHSLKEIKASSKGKGPDIFEIMKGFNMGTPPMF